MGPLKPSTRKHSNMCKGSKRSDEESAPRPSCQSSLVLTCHLPVHNSETKIEIDRTGWRCSRCVWDRHHEDKGSIKYLDTFKTQKLSSNSRNRSAWDVPYINHTSTILTIAWISAWWCWRNLGATRNITEREKRLCQQAALLPPVPTSEESHCLLQNDQDMILSGPTPNPPTRLVTLPWALHFDHSSFHLQGSHGFMTCRFTSSQLDLHQTGSFHWQIPPPAKTWTLEVNTKTWHISCEARLHDSKNIKKP